MKITAVSYINTKPFLYGLFQSPLETQLDINIDIPSVCADKLIAGRADIGLIPVAAIPEIPDAHIISDYCIGSDGKVDTVCLFSQVPIEEVEHCFLDFHSRTSAQLTKILFEEYWKIKPLFLPTQEGYINRIEGKTAGLVIGDRAIGLSSKFQYTYDLGEIWKLYTGLPFVFAAWVSRQPLDELFKKQFNEALKSGIAKIPQLAMIIPANPIFDVKQYLTKRISYSLDTDKKMALKLFLSKFSLVEPTF